MDTVKQDNNIFYPYEIIYENNQKYLYNIITSGIFLLNNMSSEVLDNYNSHALIGQEYNEIIKLMENKFIIKTDKNEKKLEEIYNKLAGKRRVLNPNSLILMMTQECNLRCIYCYGVNGEYSHKGIMDETTSISAIEYFVQHTTLDKLNICFFGGEPLLNFKLIKKIVEYAKSIEQKTHKTFSFSMTTNATLINKEIEEFIIQNNISTTISIDGNRDIQDSNRYYANKKGCYNDVIKNTERLRKTNLLIARATISPQNLDILKSIDHLIDIGFRKVAWAPALNLLNDEQIEQLIQNEIDIIKKIEEYLKIGYYDRAKKYYTICNILNKLKSDGLRTKACGAGTNMIAVNIEGNIYPCHRFVGNDNMIIGDISADKQCENAKFYSNIGLKDFANCQICLARNVCAGGCVSDNFEANQDITISPEKYCKYYPTLIKEVIKLYIRMSDDMKSGLFGQQK